MREGFYSTHPELSQEEFTALALKEIGQEKAKEALTQMFLIRHLEIRGEAAYQMGKIGGFYHAYMGQEAIQTACVQAIGKEHWWTTTYRCHALALLLGESANSVMAELFGKESGVAKGRGGSMHLYAEQMLGGFGIVGGHLPIAAGAAFTSHYLGEKKLSICFLGDGAVAQGAFHETLNLAALWHLPVLFVIENNQWGMGTHVERAICKEPIAESQAPSYGMSGYTVDGMDYFGCFMAFREIAKEVSEGKPVLVECLCERFKGHSISDPGLYRSKEQLEEVKRRDPIARLSSQLIEMKVMSEEQVKEVDQEMKQKVLEALEFADKSLDPPLASLEEGVYAAN